MGGWGSGVGGAGLGTGNFTPGTGGCEGGGEGGATVVAVGRTRLIRRTACRAGEIQLGPTRLAEFCPRAVRLLTVRTLHKEFLQDSGRQSLLFEEVIEFPHRQAQLIRDGAKRQFPPLIASVQMTQYLLIATFDKVTNHGSLGGMLPCYDAANVFCDAVINYCVDADGHL